MNISRNIDTLVVSGFDDLINREIDSRIDCKIKPVKKKMQKYIWTHPKKRSNNGFHK